MTDAGEIAQKAQRLSQISAELAADAQTLQQQMQHAGIDPFTFGMFVFVLACFVGYFVVWRVTPALHTPLMAVTNAISGIVILGAIIALGPQGFGVSHIAGFFAVILASINIFGGFIVTQRMLSMFQKKTQPTPTKEK